MGAYHRGLRALVKGALRLVYPAQCLCCGSTVAEEGALCSACWPEADFISHACCDMCGVPLPGDAGDHGLICDDCLSSPEPWTRARAALTYRGAGRKLALMLKHGDRLDIAPSLGVWAARAAAPLILPGMVVVPVPLHPRRMMRRKYNQAAELGRHVAREHGLDFAPRALRRVRHTPMQDHGSQAERFANLQDSLILRESMAPQLRGRPILLVDDVMASGATLCAAATALLEWETGPICAVVLARAVKDA